MKRLIFIYLITFSTLSLMAQNKKDNESIKKMCGCFEVTFNFAETFNYSKDSLYKPSKNKVSKALEWAQLDAQARTYTLLEYVHRATDSQAVIIWISVLAVCL